MTNPTISSLFLDTILLRSPEEQNRTDNMSYIPSITLPDAVFNTPAISILLPLGLGLGAGYISSIVSDTPEKAYKQWKLPPYRPPPQVFAPVWTALYGLMGYGAYRAWNTGMSSLNPLVIEDTRRGATLYTVQLALNMMFMPLFFSMRRPVEGTVNIIALTGTVGYLTYIWNQIDPIASYCLVPYVGWLSFATYLAGGIGYLNDWDLNFKTTPVAEKEDPKTQ